MALSPDLQLLNNRSTGLLPIKQYPLTDNLGPGGNFVRDSVAWYFNSAGLLVQAAIDIPRFDYRADTITNHCLDSRD